MKGTPWQPVPGRDGMEVKSRVVIPSDHKDKAEAVQGEDKEVQTRRLRINKKDIEKFGMTPGCDGCRAANRGAPARNHNEDCRKRITEELREIGDQRVEREQEKLESPAHGQFSICTTLCHLHSVN